MPACTPGKGPDFMGTLSGPVGACNFYASHSSRRVKLFHPVQLLCAYIISKFTIAVLLPAAALLFPF